MPVTTTKTRTWEHVITLPEGLTLHAKGEEGKDTVEILVAHPATETEEEAALSIIVFANELHDWLGRVAESLRAAE